MRHFFYSISKANRVVFQRLWHALAIFLVLVSNFGTLAIPVEAKAQAVLQEKVNPKQADTLNAAPRPRLAQPDQSLPSAQNQNPNSSTATTPTIYFGCSNYRTNTDDNWNRNICSSVQNYSFVLPPIKPQTFHIVLSKTVKSPVSTTEYPLTVICSGVNCPASIRIYYHIKVNSNWGRWFYDPNLITPDSTLSSFSQTVSAPCTRLPGYQSGPCEVEMTGSETAVRQSNGSYSGLYFEARSSDDSAIAFRWDILVSTDPSIDGIPNDSVNSFCNCSQAGGDQRESTFTTQVQTQGSGGDPINTRTGGFEYPVEDLSLQTSAGPLVFQRDYSSAMITRLTVPLGPGWTHNQDTRLIFPTDPGGEVGFVLFKAHSANLYKFNIENNNLYRPGAGITATLVKSAPSALQTRLVGLPFASVMLAGRKLGSYVLEVVPP